MTFCEPCWKDFQDIEYHNQASAHIPGSQYKCEECNRWFNNKKARHRHFGVTDCVKTSISAYRCHPCNTEFRTGKALRTHRLVHQLQPETWVNTLETIPSEPSVSITPSGAIPPKPLVEASSPGAFCELCWKSVLDIERHNQTATHTKGPRSKCGECNQWFSRRKARTRHFEATGCVRTPASDHRLQPPVRLIASNPSTNTTPTVSSDLLVDITPIAPVPSDSSVDIPHTMAFCELCCKSFPDFAAHINTTVHQRGPIHHCNTCPKGFSSKMAIQRHYATTSCVMTLVTEFRCCDCAKNFASAKALRKHLRNKVLHPTSERDVVALDPSAGYCEECHKIFKTKKALTTHLASVIHNPLMEPMKCLGGNSCKKSFATPSGMLAHLESGVCRSGLSRDLIDDLVIANDPTNIITDPVAVETRARDRMSIAASEYTTSFGGSVRFTPSEASIAYSNSTEDWSDIFTTSSESDGTITPGRRGSDSDSDSNFQYTPGGGMSSSTLEYLRTPSDSSDSSSGVYLTPSESGGSGSGVYLTPSESGASGSGVYLTTSDFGGSGMLTPTSFSSELQTINLTCPLCPPNNPRKFKTVDGLHTHMRSKVHAAKIYHCPQPLTALGSGPKGTGKKQRSFTTLSGLTQHVEAGACDGGKETFNTAIAFVNDKLRDMGMAGIKVIGQ